MAMETQEDEGIWGGIEREMGMPDAESPEFLSAEANASIIMVRNWLDAPRVVQESPRPTPGPLQANPLTQSLFFGSPDALWLVSFSI